MKNDIEECVTQRFGYFSTSKAERFGYAIYSTPTGEDVSVTCIADSPNLQFELTQKGWKNDDSICVGQITSYKKTVRSAQSLAEWCVSKNAGISNTESPVDTAAC